MRNKTKRQWFLMTIGLAALAVISLIATGTVIATSPAITSLSRWSLTVLPFLQQRNIRSGCKS